MVAKHSLRASPRDSLKWKIKIQNLQKKKLYSTPTTSPFLEITGLIILLKKFHTFNKIPFLFPKI